MTMGKVAAQVVKTEAKMLINWYGQQRVEIAPARRINEHRIKMDRLLSFVVLADRVIRSGENLLDMSLADAVFLDDCLSEKDLGEQ